MKKLKQSPIARIAFTFIVGLVVEIGLLFSNGNRMSIDNIIIMGLFFVIVGLVFFVSARYLNKASNLKESLNCASDKITELNKNNTKDILTVIKNDENLFQNELLDKQFKHYKNDLDLVSGEVPDSRVDIEKYINMDMLEEAIYADFLNWVPGIMTGLGILGTFIGLSLGLNSFDLSGSSSEIEQKITPLMEGIKVAFHTSICGLIYSLLFNAVFKHEFQLLEQSMDNFLDTYETDVVNALENGSVQNEIKYHNRIVNVLLEQMELQKEMISKQNDQNDAVTGLLYKQIELTENNPNTIIEKIQEMIIPCIDRMSESIEQFAVKTQESQIDQLERVVDQFIIQMNQSLGNSFTELATIISKTSDWQKTVLEEMQLVIEKVNSLAVDLATINTGIETSIVSVKGYTDIVDAAQQKIVDNLVSLNEVIEISKKEIEQGDKALIDLMAFTEKTNTAMKAYIGEVHTQLENFNTMDEKFREKTQSEMAEFVDNLYEINESVQENNKKHIDALIKSADSYISAVNNNQKETMLKLNSIHNEAVKSLESMENTAVYSMEKVHEKALKNIDSLGDKANAHLEEIGTLKEGMNIELENSAKKLSEAADNLSDNMNARIKETFVTFDEELAEVVKHFSGTLNQMDKAIDKVPFVINDTYADLDSKLKEMRISLEGYLEYADKLHHSIEAQWKQFNDYDK